MNDKPIFYDTDCLSSFLIVNESSILENLFSKIIIPSEVYEELSNKSTPFKIKKNLEKLLDRGFIEIYYISTDSNTYKRYKTYISGTWHKKIGKGEASAIALSIENKGILASNNLRDIKKYVDEYKIPLITTAIILCKSVDKNIINDKEANIIWDKMKKRFLPKVSFNEYYSTMYKNDLCEFFDSKI